MNVAFGNIGLLIDGSTFTKSPISRRRDETRLGRVEMMETQEEVELVSMGFPHTLAAEALKATGGDILKATDWILSRSTPRSPPPSITNTITHPTSPSDDNSPPSASASASLNFQPKIDRFFHFRHETQTQPQHHHTPTDTPDNDRLEKRKRPKLREEESNNDKKQPLHPLLPPPPSVPLSERMRPRTLDDVVGQDHLLGPTSVLRSSILRGRLPSILLWGPPGSGKTSIARAILNSSSSHHVYRFVPLSAVNSGVKEVRDAVDEAKKSRRTTTTLLFIDEVHRFNKAQQDSLLPVIEDGSIVFIGATTENPSFHLITPLLSRCTVLALNPLRPHHIATLLKRAVSDHSHKGLSSSSKIEVEDEAIQFLSNHCDGDARVALNKLEISATTAAAARLRQGAGSSDSDVLLVTLSHVKEAMQCKHISYDRDGEEHYNLISALHKSMRGSDADASMYWLARMLEGGEQPLYIARRLIRFASEDVGLADPSALTQAVACYQACHFIGMPECNVNLAQCVAYLALAPKSVSVYKAIEDAQKVVRESVGQNEGVPLHLRNAPTKLMKDIGYGKGYVYPPDNPNALSQTYMPPSLQGYKFLHWPNAPASD